MAHHYNYIITKLHTRTIVLGITILILQFCSGCALIISTRINEKIGVDVPAKATIVEVFSGDTLTVIEEEEEAGTKKYIKLRNGRKHVLKISNDSLTQYTTFDIKADAWGVLNAYTPVAIGFLTDQVLGTSHKVSPNFLRASKLNTIPLQQQQRIEDSLRKINRFPYAHSLVDDRTNNLITIWGGFGVSGPANLGLPFPNVAQYGVGFTFIPQVQLFYEYTVLGGLSFGEFDESTTKLYQAGVFCKNHVLGYLFPGVLEQGMWKMHHYEVAIPRMTLQTQRRLNTTRILTRWALV